MKNLNAAAFCHITEPNYNLEATGLNVLTAKNTRPILKSWLSFYTQNNDPNTTTYPNFERKLKLFKMRPVGSSLSYTQRWLHASSSSFQNLMHQSSELLDKQKWSNVKIAVELILRENRSNCWLLVKICKSSSKHEVSNSLLEHYQSVPAMSDKLLREP